MSKGSFIFIVLMYVTSTTGLCIGLINGIARDRKAEGLPSVKEIKLAQEECEKNLPRSQKCIPKVTWEVITP